MYYRYTCTVPVYQVLVLVIGFFEIYNNMCSLQFATVCTQPGYQYRSTRVDNGVFFIKMYLKVLKLIYIQFYTSSFSSIQYTSTGCAFVFRFIHVSPVPNVFQFLMNAPCLCRCFLNLLASISEISIFRSQFLIFVSTSYSFLF